MAQLRQRLEQHRLNPSAQFADADLRDLVGVGINGHRWGYRALVASKSIAAVEV